MAIRKSHILLSSALALAALCPRTAVAAGAETHTQLQLNHLDVGVTAGSTGIGLNIEMPVFERVHLRAGIEYMPRLTVPMSFNLMSYAGTGEDDEEAQASKFDRMSQLMEDFTGIKVDRKVDMNAKGTMLDFRLMVDWYPLRSNKHWYATAGFYWGRSKVGHIENTIGEAPSLMAVIIYNRMYDYFKDYTYMDEPYLGTMYLDPDVGDAMRDKFMRYGRVGAHVGDYTDGNPYIMLPDEEGMVKADMFVNKFKPYLGIGYKTSVDKAGRWSIGFDAGALFWGKPSIITHEGVDIAADVDNVKGKVGDYLSVAKVMHVYPVLNFRISYTLF